MQAEFSSLKGQNGKRLLCGLAVGAANGLFGGGGGMLAVPLLQKMSVKFWVNITHTAIVLFMML